MERFKNRQELFLAIAPEGTREKVEAWRTGFYYIAHGARVPIVPCYIDYDRKVIGTGPTIDPSGDLAADLQAIQSFYAGITAKNPSQA